MFTYMTVYDSVRYVVELKYFQIFFNFQFLTFIFLMVHGEFHILQNSFWKEMILIHIYEFVIYISVDIQISLYLLLIQML